MKKIAMPTTPNFINSTFTLTRTVSQTMSPFTGKIRTQDFGGVFWKCDCQLPPMNRSQASNWQSFLLDLEGPTNVFEFADPDALTNTGTYTNAHLQAQARITDTSVTLTFANSTQRLTASDNVFTTSVLNVGDFIHITGAVNEENNGTHKITARVSDTIVVLGESFLVDESNTANCKIQQNKKGATALSLKGSSNSSTGTIKKGDYLGIRSTSNSTDTVNPNDPVQLVMVVEDAVETNEGNSARNEYSVKIQPKLRADIADNAYIRFASPKGMFRLVSSEASWSADKTSLYGISISCIEVV